MLRLDQFDNIYLYRNIVDFRKSIDGLLSIVQDEMCLNPFQNHLFIFTNHRRNKVKMLYWDKTGHALWYKRLDQSYFRWPLKSENEVINLTPQKLEWLLSGIDILKLKPHKELFFENFN